VRTVSILRAKLIDITLPPWTVPSPPPGIFKPITVE